MKKQSNKEKRKAEIRRAIQLLLQAESNIGYARLVLAEIHQEWLK